MSLRKRLRAIVLGCAIVLASAALPAMAQQITGAGSTFVYPILAKWSEAYNKAHNIQINYQSIGSGGGIAQIKAGTVTFGASDKPLDATDLQQSGLAQFPCVIGAILPVVNLPDVKPGDLRFTGALLADIYLGKVKKWNDPAIASLNKGVKSPQSRHHRGTPVRRLRHHVQLGELSLEGQPGLEIESRRRHLGGLADRGGREGE